MSSKTIKMRPADGEIIEIPLDAAVMSHTIKDMLEHLGQDSEIDTEIPVPNVTHKTLQRVAKWCEKWKNTPQPTSDEIKDKLADKIDTWDEDYLKMDLQDLYDLVSISFRDISQIFLEPEIKI